MNAVQRNNVTITGKGSVTLLFAHGFGCEQNMWRFITPAFAENYKIVLFDYVGCGNSDYSAYNVEKYSSLHGYAQDVIDICKELDLSDVIFIGHSVSAMIGTLASIQVPGIFKNLIFVAPSPKYINEAEYFGGFTNEDIDGLLEVMESNFDGWASFLAPVVMQNKELPDFTSELQESFCNGDREMTKRFARLTFTADNRDDIAKIKVPTLILQCSEDAIAPANVGEYLNDTIKGSTLVRMEATGHCPHMSHPRETIDVLSKYLQDYAY
jgi:sigma-B regulation protein RsbQ